MIISRQTLDDSSPTRRAEHAGGQLDIVSALLAQWDHHPHSTVLRWRASSEHWLGVTGQNIARRVRCLARGLQRLGVGQGSAVGILAQPSLNWLLIDLATQAAGGMSVPLFPNSAPTTLRSIAQQAHMGWCFVEGELAQSAAPHLAEYGCTLIGPTCDLAIDDIEAQGADDPIASGSAHNDDIATLIFTSGSTGMPKGVALSHGNLQSQMEAARERFPIDRDHDRAVSALPWAHVFERMVLYTYLWTGVPVAIATDVKNLGPDLIDVQPTVLTVVPRLLEKLHMRIRGQAESLTGIRKMIARWALNRAERSVIGPLDRFAERAVYETIRGRLGGHLRMVICGGAALNPLLERFYHHVGVPVYSGYGLTEASPVISCNCPGKHRFATVGQPFPEVEVRIDGSGEILARSPGIMQGYHGDPLATSAVIDNDGWLHTGDRGRLDDDGYLVITGRIKELMKTAGGKYVAPVPIEQQLVHCPLIDQAMVVADGLPFVSALLFPDFEVLARLQAEHGCSDMPHRQALNQPWAAALIEDAIVRCNETLDHWQQIRRWCVIEEAPSVHNGELTPTFKLRRNQIRADHRGDIDAMYQEGRS